MHGKRLVVGTAAVAAAGLIALTTSLASAPAVASSGTSGSSAPASARSTEFTAYSDNDGPTASVVVTGAVGDYGQAISVNPDGSVNPEHNSQLELALGQGSVRLDIAALDKKLVKAFGSFPTNRTTCSGTVRVSGATPVVPGSGTGLYQGASGSFTTTITVAEVDAKADCGTSSAFLKQQLVMSGSGRVTLP
jgi:hypothetical protein